MIKLKDISIDPPTDLSDKELKKKVKDLQDEIAELQHQMYAQGKHSLLVVLQGMDASGKDGTVKNVFREVPAFGIDVRAFKVPTKEELAHDFLWRIHKEAPKKGMIKVFNRSHYEDVLVTRVLGLVDDKTAQERFRLINDFERLLQHNNTHILKFYLHISYEEQEKRLLERTVEPHKFYKHSDGDWDNRPHWDEYMRYYEACFEHTQEAAPWHIVPVGSKRYKEYYIATEIVKALKSMNLEYPELDSERF